jgi:hypothetical protein
LPLVVVRSHLPDCGSAHSSSTGYEKREENDNEQRRTIRLSGGLNIWKNKGKRVFKEHRLSNMPTTDNGNV